MEASEARADGQGSFEDELSTLSPAVSITSAEEVFKAVELGLVNKTEARRVLGFEMGRGRSARGQLRGSRGRFASSDRVARHRLMLGDAERLGQNHPEALLAKSDLARVLASEGELAEARQLLEEAVAGWRDRLGVNDPTTLLAMSDLASVLSDEGQHERARKLQEYVLRSYRELLGEWHRDTLTAQRNLAGTLRAQGMLAEAYQLEMRALDMGRQSGDEDPTVMEVAQVEAGVPKGQSTTTPGLVGAARELEIKVLHAGPRADDPEMLAAAQRLQEEVLGVYQQTLGEDHPLTVNANMHLAVVVALQGQEAIAEQLLEELVRQVETDMRPLDSLLVKVYIATRLSGPTEPAAAQRLYEEILKIYDAEFGPDDPNTIAMKLYVATVLAKQGHPAARGLQEEVVDSYSKFVGEDNETTAAMRTLWFEARSDQDQPKVAYASEEPGYGNGSSSDNESTERPDDETRTEEAARVTESQRRSTSGKQSARRGAARARQSK
jgi:tetratricopeptide (TPR) repeat protein